MENILAEKKLEARRRRLNHFDVTDFSRVPPHIVNAFFGDGSYRSRLFVTTFAFINGLTLDQLLRMLHWRPFTLEDRGKISDLFLNYLPKPEYGRKYYSYNTTLNLMIFCDGCLRINGERVVHN